MTQLRQDVKEFRVNSDALFRRTDSQKRVRLPLRLRPLALLLSARQNQS